MQQESFASHNLYGTPPRRKVAKNAPAFTDAEVDKEIDRYKPGEEMSLDDETLQRRAQMDPGSMPPGTPPRRFYLARDMSQGAAEELRRRRAPVASQTPVNNNAFSNSTRRLVQPERVPATPPNLPSNANNAAAISPLSAKSVAELEAIIASTPAQLPVGTTPTPMDYAAVATHREAMKALMSRGAPMSFEDVTGWHD